MYSIILFQTMISFSTDPVINQALLQRLIVFDLCHANFPKGLNVDRGQYIEDQKIYVLAKVQGMS